MRRRICLLGTAGATALAAAVAAAPAIVKTPPPAPRPVPRPVSAAAHAPAPAPVAAQAPASRPVGAVDPVVVPDCRLAVMEKQEVPAQRDGILLFVGTEVAAGEAVPADRLITVKVGDQDRKYRRLREGDAVRAGQLVALLDDRLARDAYAIKRGQVVVSEAELAAAERSRDEAKERYLTQLKLRGSTAGPAASEEDVGGAKLVWYRNHYESISKKEALALANLELHQAQTVVGMYEVRAAIPGVIKKTFRGPGEAVHALDPVLEVRNLTRLRAEGLVEVQYLDRLHEGMRATVEPTQVVGPQVALGGHLQEITAVAVAGGPDPDIVSASEDGTVRVWRRGVRRERCVLRHPAPVRALACAPPGSARRYCLAGLADGTAWLWDLDAPDRPLRTLDGAHRAAVSAAAFSPEGLLCVTGGDDRDICLWEVTTGRLRYRFPAGHVGGVTALQWLPSSHVLSAGRDNTLRLWSVGSTGATPDTSLDRRSGDVARPGASPDGRLALFDQGNALQVLGLPGGYTEGTLQNPSTGAGFAAFALFSPDGRLVLTAGASDGHLQLWRSPTDGGRCHEVCQLAAPDRAAATCAAFAPDGSFAVTGTRDRQVLVWPLPARDELERQVPAAVTLIERAVESSARQVRVAVELPNPDGRLVPGTTATVTLYPGE